MKRGETKPPIHVCPECGRKYKYHLPFHNHLWEHSGEDEQVNHAKRCLWGLDYSVRLSPFREFADVGDGRGRAERPFVIDIARRRVVLSWSVPADQRAAALSAAVRAIAGETTPMAPSGPATTSPVVVPTVVNSDGELYLVRLVDGYPEDDTGQPQLCVVGPDRVVRVSRLAPASGIFNLVSRALGVVGA